MEEEAATSICDLSDVVPASAIDSVNRTLEHLGDLEGNLLKCLSLADPEVVAEMPPLDRARVFLVLAKTATTLHTVRLRCSGIQIDGHQVEKEIERLRIFEEKLEKHCDRAKAPLRPSTTINYQAATRFIERSLPDLTAEQRMEMREISRRKGTKRRIPQKKRKYQAPEKESVRAAAQEFLEKAMRELRGSGTEGLRGPLRIESSDEEDGQTS